MVKKIRKVKMKANFKRIKFFKIFEYTIGWILLIVSFLSIVFYSYFYYKNNVRLNQTQEECSIQETLNQQMNFVNNLVNEKISFVNDMSSQMSLLGDDFHSQEILNLVDITFNGISFFQNYYIIDEFGLAKTSTGDLDVSLEYFYARFLQSDSHIVLEDIEDTEIDKLYFYSQISKLDKTGIIAFSIDTVSFKNYLNLSSYNGGGISILLTNLNDVIMPIDNNYSQLLSSYLSDYTAENEIKILNGYYILKKNIPSANWKLVIMVSVDQFPDVATIIKKQMVWFIIFICSSLLLFVIVLHFIFYWGSRTNEIKFREAMGQIAKFRITYDNKTDKLSINENASMLLNINNEFKDFSRNKILVGGYSYQELKDMVYENLSLSNGVETSKFLIETKHIPNKNLLVEIELTIIRKNKNFVMYGIIDDVTKQKKELELYQKREWEKLTKKANLDQLTGLYNRAHFVDSMMQSINNGIEGVNCFMLIDLDNFKAINDTYGHNVGDDVLIRTGATLKYSLREHDIVGRLGGDEFCVYLSGAKVLDNVKQKVKEIINNISSLYILNDSKEKLNCSIGIVIVDSKENKFECLYHEADKNLQIAKKDGGNNYYIRENLENIVDDTKKETKNINRACVNDYFVDIIFNSERNPDKVKKILLTAIEKNEFTFHLQPIVDKNKFKIYSAEILSRWNSPIYGLIYPNNIIEVFEKLNIIYNFDIYVLEKAFALYKSWKENGNYCPLTINQSSHTIVSSGYDAKLKELVLKYDVNPKDISIDINEKCGLTSYRQLIKMVDSLKEIGFEIAIDDYGSGNSSNVLKKLNVDYIKLDKTFIDSEETSAQKTLSLIKNTILLAHELNLKVVSEGVENEDIVQVLVGFDCDYMQGYYFDKPLEIKTFEKKYLKKE